MKPFKGIVLVVFCLILALLFLSSETQRALMQKAGKKEQQITPGKPKDILVKEFLRDLNKDIQPGSILLPNAEFDEESEDPDLPPGMAGLIDKEAYLRLRGDYIDMRRGRPSEEADELRTAAIVSMKKQEALEKGKTPAVPSLFDQVNWNFRSSPDHSRPDNYESCSGERAYDRDSCSPNRPEHCVCRNGTRRTL